MIKQLWAPWRMEYLADSKAKGCVFCRLPKEADDRKNLILYRGKSMFVILNKYPYNNGHLMVVPYPHIDKIWALEEQMLSSLMRLTQISAKCLSETYKPSGFNIGMNIGRAGGAGIEEHLHMHVVPRWLGDANFMPILADTKSMPQHILESYDQMFPFFKEVSTV